MDNFFTNISEYFRIDSEMLYYYISLAIKIAFIFVLAKLVTVVLNRVVVNIFKLYPRFKFDERKSGTLLGILRSIIKYVVYIIMGISILDILILFEDQYSVGDYITVNGVTGTVEDIGLRITHIRSFKGELHIIPNGEIKAVTNSSRGNSLAIIDVGVAYESDQEKALIALNTIAENYFANNQDKVAEKPEVQGIIKLGESDVVLRTIIKTQPLIHWKVEREMRMLILETFKKENIEIPYPRRVILERQ
ncbi:MAG: MscS Mechanosensitive ion channel [Clostridia bacterium]|nr:MscS Mechanosensitive ion channel [Clostridia bacterium]